MWKWVRPRWDSGARSQIFSFKWFRYVLLWRQSPNGSWASWTNVYTKKRTLSRLRFWYGCIKSVWNVVSDCGIYCFEGNYQTGPDSESSIICVAKLKSCLRFSWRTPAQQLTLKWIFAWPGTRLGQKRATPVPMLTAIWIETRMCEWQKIKNLVHPGNCCC